MSTAPALFLGLRLAAGLVEANTGNADDGTMFATVMRSNRLAPNGLAMTATFVAIHVTVSYADAQTIIVRLIVDDVTTITRTVALPAQGTPTQYKFRVFVSVPLVVDGIERIRLHPRGTWAQVELETDGTADCSIDGLELEWDPAGRL